MALLEPCPRSVRGVSDHEERVSEKCPKPDGNRFGQTHPFFRRVSSDCPRFVPPGNQPMSRKTSRPRFLWTDGTSALWGLGKAAYLGVAIRDEYSPRLRRALERRRDSSLTGRCPCGASIPGWPARCGPVRRHDARARLRRGRSAARPDVAGRTTGSGRPRMSPQGPTARPGRPLRADKVKGGPQPHGDLTPSPSHDWIWNPEWRRKPDDEWQTCTACWQVSRLRDMRQITQVWRWRVSATEPGGPMPARVVSVCGLATASERCKAQVVKLCGGTGCTTDE